VAIFTSALVCVALFVGMLVLLEVGVRIGRRFRGASDKHEAGVLDGAIFALLGLLLGFAFAGAMSRLDIRRELIVQEANAIGTAYLRVDLMSEDSQPAIRALFRDYLQARLDIYASIDKGADPATATAAASRLQQQIWNAGVAASRQDMTNRIAMSVLPAFNDMIDITSARAVARDTHMPVLITALLMGVALLSALLAGYAMARPGWRHFLHGGVYAMAVAFTIYVVLDLDNPRSGLIRLNAADRILQNLQTSL
jgi:hypothetical protein